METYHLLPAMRLGKRPHLLSNLASLKEKENMADLFAFLQGLDELKLINLASMVIMLTALIVAACLIFLKAEYGRYFSANSTQKYGFGVNARVAWFVQELPAFVVPCVLVCYARKDVFGFTPNMILLSLLFLHYTHR